MLHRGERKGAELRFRAEPLVSVIGGEILDQYPVDQAVVYVVEEGEHGRGRYIVSEPSLSEEEHRIYSIIMESLFFSLKPVAKIDDPIKYVEGYIWEAAEELGLVDQVEKAYPKYRYFITRDALGYGLIDVAMKDVDVEEISCEGYGRPVAVIHRRFTQYDWLDTNIQFPSEDTLRSFVQKLALKTGKSVTVATPFTDSMTREGHRVAVTFTSEVTLPGSTFDIRKFPQEPFSIAHLIQFNTLSPLMAAYLWMLIEYRGFVMTIGPMGSGKTSTINSLATMIPPSLKVASIEDTPELKLPHAHWQRFKSRRSYSITESRFDVDLMDLTKLSMRYRPDYIILGEVRGEEISALIQAAAIGHGCICSLHAENPESALVRMSSPPMDVKLAGQMLIWNFLLLNRVKDKQGQVIRRALSSTEVVPQQEGLVQLKRVFEWDPREDVFKPDEAKKVAEASYRLSELCKLTGWTRNDLVEEIEQRQILLEGLVEEGALSFSQVTEAIRGFYASRLKTDASSRGSSKIED